MSNILKIFHVSDTHGDHENLVVPECDILVHSGDFQSSRDLSDEEKEMDVTNFMKWAYDQPANTCIVVPGNHDDYIMPLGFGARVAYIPTAREYKPPSPYDCFSGIFYHNKKEINICTSPITPASSSKSSYAYPRMSEALRECREKIEENVDILITHGPPHGHLDMADSSVKIGCEFLRDRLDSLNNPPKLHLFGHCHENYGHKATYNEDGSVRTVYVNSSYGKFRGIKNQGHMITLSLETHLEIISVESWNGKNG